MTYFDQHNERLSLRLAAGFSRISTALRHRAWRDGHPRDLTPTQGQVLVLLERRPHSTLAQIAENLGVRASTASEAVSVLEGKGLVAKQRDPADRRALCLVLTRRGEEMAANASQWPDFLACTIDELSHEEAEILMRVLQRMIRVLQERGEIPVARLCTTCRYFRPFVHSDARRPHHCAFANAPFGDADLRLDCQDHQPADGPEGQAALARFHGGSLGA